MTSRTSKPTGNRAGRGARSNRTAAGVGRLSVYGRPRLHSIVAVLACLAGFACGWFGHAASRPATVYHTVTGPAAQFAGPCRVVVSGDVVLELAPGQLRTRMEPRP